MADPLQIKTSTRRINGISTRIETNVETGAANLYQDNGLAGRTLIATGSARGNTWTVTNAFAAVYSTRVGRTLTKSEAQTLFAKDFQNLANNDRASLINTWSPPGTKTFLATQGKVPGIIDPATGLKTGQTAQTTVPPGPAPTTTPASTGGGSDPLPNSANQNLADPNAFTSLVSNIEGKTPQKNYGILKYPADSVDGLYDYLKVTVLKYSRKGLLQRGEGASFGNVFLPMHPNISDANGVSWNEDRMNILQAQFGTLAYNTISRAGTGKDVGEFLGKLGSDMVSTIGNISATPGLDKLIAGYFAGQAVSSNVLGRATGAVINNNLELLFDGPKLRTFRYNFRFTPRDADEAKVVKQIIRLFKKEMAPDQTPGYLFLTTPNVFKLEYIYGKTQKIHPYLNVIKTCALTDFSVNYTPDGSYMTYEGEPSMTSYTVDMQFSELEPIYKADQETKYGMGY